MVNVLNLALTASRMALAAGSLFVCAIASTDKNDRAADRYKFFMIFGLCGGLFFRAAKINQLRIQDRQ